MVRGPLINAFARQACAVLFLVFKPAVFFNPSASGSAAPPSGSSTRRSRNPASPWRTAPVAMIAPIAADVREQTIWSYWAQGSDKMPDFFKMCVETWHRHNPTWDIRILDLSTVHDYLSPEELPNTFMELTSHQTASDCVRLGLLSRYGGIWMDVSILLRCDLESLCWSEIQSGQKSAAVMYHPDFGTAAFQHKDFVESWFLATKPGNPFFMQWRDLLCELLHDRYSVTGLLSHPLYQGLDLSGIHLLNSVYGASFDFREYLAIHTMCHRILETEEERRSQWQDHFVQIDAAATAFKLQLHMADAGQAVSFALLSDFKPEPGFMDDVPLMKFTTIHSALLQTLQKDQIADDSKFSPLEMPSVIGRLVSEGPAYTRAMSLLKEMRDMGLRPSRISYNAAIAACEKEGRWEDALALLEEMRSSAVVPSVLSINTAISACKRANQYGSAMSLLADLPRENL